MQFGKRTIILGGNVGGILSLEQYEKGLHGKLKTSAKGADISLAVAEGQKIALIAFENFSDFDLYGFDQNNLNVYILKQNSIIAHGKSAAERPSDFAIYNLIRSYHESKKKQGRQETVDKSDPSPLSKTQVGSQDGDTAAGQKRNIGDFLHNIIRYDDEAIAEVNYYDKHVFSPPSPEIIPKSGSYLSEAAALKEEHRIKLNKEDSVSKSGGQRYFAFENAADKLSPAAYERGFLNGSYLVAASKPRAHTGHKRGVSTRSGLRQTEGEEEFFYTAPPHRSDLDAGNFENPASKRIKEVKEIKEIKNASVSENGEGEIVPAPVIEANFFEEVAAQIDTLMREYPHEERLEKIIPSSKWASIPLEGGGHYVIGSISDLYIVYGVPGKFDAPPAELKGSVWLPLSDPEGEGYWVLFQDASTGKSIEVTFEF